MYSSSSWFPDKPKSRSTTSRSDDAPMDGNAQQKSTGMIGWRSQEVPVPTPQPSRATRNHMVPSHLPPATFPRIPGDNAVTMHSPQRNVTTRNSRKNQSAYDFGSVTAPVPVVRRKTGSNRTNVWWTDNEEGVETGVPGVTTGLATTVEEGVDDTRKGTQYSNSDHITVVTSESFSDEGSDEVSVSKEKGARLSFYLCVVLFCVIISASAGFITAKLTRSPSANSSDDGKYVGDGSNGDGNNDESTRDEKEDGLSQESDNFTSAGEDPVVDQPPAGNSDTLVGVYYYPWHGDNNFHDKEYLRGELIPPQQPMLGEYNDRDPEVIKQHLRWTRNANIGLWVTSWWGPDSTSDVTTKELIFPNVELGETKIALFYEPSILKWSSKFYAADGSPYYTADRVYDDAVYMARHYFSNPNYHRIDGRPVVFCYNSRWLEDEGILESFVENMKRGAWDQGQHDVYIVGDHAFYSAPNNVEEYKPFQLLDAVTIVDVYGSLGRPDFVGSGGVRNYKAKGRGWLEAAKNTNCSYIPTATAGYNDRGVNPGKENPVMSRRLTKKDRVGSLFQALLSEAINLKDSRTGGIVMINSFNNWHGDTQIEPVRIGGFTTNPQGLTTDLRYVGYGSLFLDIVKAATTGATVTLPFDAALQNEGYPQENITIVRDSVIDSSSLTNTIMAGYQGWFGTTCDNGYNRWKHWAGRGRVPGADHYEFDRWPDLTEFDSDELCPTELQYSNGDKAMLFSSFNIKTVDRHVQWMHDYGIDGVFVQRFINEVRNDRYERDRILDNIRRGSEKYGRIFVNMYDISGAKAEDVYEDLKNDWMHLVDDEKITESDRYLRHNQRPLLAIWGFGFASRVGDPEKVRELIDWFQNNPVEKYRVTLMGGVPTYWRTLTRDSKSASEWAAIYRSFDVIAPWSVGRYKSINGVNNFKEQLLEPDIAECESLGIEYLPAVFPGYSHANVYDKDFNEIPRNGGEFYWRQFHNAIEAGGKQVYVSMFDEVDEATAIFKVAENAEQTPTEGRFLTLDADGIDVPNDWYLTLTGRATTLLRSSGVIPSTMPALPG